MFNIKVNLKLQDNSLYVRIPDINRNKQACKQDMSLHEYVFKLIIKISVSIITLYSAKGPRLIQRRPLFQLIQLN